ncbi:MAG: PorT family protein, partial [Proteobacteria bacterium]|nr:PorT family protein [Pseudomonadota bacterium]
AVTGFAADVNEITSEEATGEETAAPETATPAPQPVLKPSETPEQAPANLSPWFFEVHLGQLRTNNSDRGNLEKTAYTGGASVEYRIMDQWFVQTELNYMNKGWKEAGLVTVSETSLKYFEVPLFLKAKFPWNNIAPSVMAGPWLAYLHSASDTTNGISLDTTSATKRFEFGIYVGAGLDLALSDDLEMGIGARYGWGLSDINQVALQNTICNRVIQLLASVRFRL